MKLIIFSLILISLCSCSFVPRYELEPNRYCKRGSLTMICPGYSPQEDSFHYLLNTMRSYDD